MKRLLAVLTAAVGLALSAVPAQAQGYFINVHYHRGYGDPTNAVVSYEGNAFPQGECAPGEDGQIIKLAFVAVYSLTETCVRPDGTVRWTEIRDASTPAVSNYLFCSEYLQPGTEHSAMIKTTHSPTRYGFSPCLSPDTLRLDSVNFQGVTLLDITNPPFDSQYRAISDDIYVPPYAGLAPSDGGVDEPIPIKP